MKKLRLLAAIPAAALAAGLWVPAQAAGATMTIMPSVGLTNGQTVVVRGSGYPAGKTVIVIECANLTGPAGCDVQRLATTTVSSSGTFQKSFIVHTGAIGNGRCNPGSTNCTITATTSDQSAHATRHVSFAAPTRTTARYNTTTHVLSATVTSGSRTVAGEVVRLYRRSGTAWVLVATLRTGTHGVVSYHVTRYASYKFVTPKQGNYLGSQSLVIKA